jgi:hypothetical protein
MEWEKPFKSRVFFLGWPGLTRVNPSDPWPACYIGSITGLGLKTMLERTEYDLSKINWLRGVILLILIVLVPWGTFPLCHTPIRPISVFRDQISILIAGCKTTWTRGSHQFEQNMSDVTIFLPLPIFARTIMSNQNNTPPPLVIELKFQMRLQRWWKEWIWWGMIWYRKGQIWILA